MLPWCDPSSGSDGGGIFLSDPEPRLNSPGSLLWLLPCQEGLHAQAAQAPGATWFSGTAPDWAFLYCLKIISRGPPRNYLFSPPTVVWTPIIIHISSVEHWTPVGTAAKHNQAWGMMKTWAAPVMFIPDPPDHPFQSYAASCLAARGSHHSGFQVTTPGPDRMPEGKFPQPTGDLQAMTASCRTNSAV